MRGLYRILARVDELERLSGGNSALHRLDPTVKLLCAAFFVVFVVSRGRYAALALLPLFVVPVAAAAVSGTPFGSVAVRAALALPFVLGATLPNCLFGDPSLGLLSALTASLKAVLCVSCVCVCVATTSAADGLRVMRALRVPEFISAQAALTARYISVLAEETLTALIAYAARGGGFRISPKDAGAFAGGLALKAMDKGERVYLAMRQRGFGGDRDG
ncbi:MAG: energy-coupling factor transporter transmembrane protein EcfT [Clostridiales bacterium]|jgi:cobalt/nickel transport system permease protein|nr:energy-coupling factor transporter transmembrane protein EcfT [Clostridiales bacterium]